MSGGEWPATRRAQGLQELGRWRPEQLLQELQRSGHGVVVSVLSVLQGQLVDLEAEVQALSPGFLKRVRGFTVFVFESYVSKSCASISASRNVSIMASAMFSKSLWLCPDK